MKVTVIGCAGSYPGPDSPASCYLVESEHDGRTWQVGEPGDLVVTAAWGCGSEATAAVVRPASGEVWVFGGWAAAGEELAAVPVTRVAGGVRAEAADSDGDGCTDLVVGRDGAAPVVVHPEAAR